MVHLVEAPGALIPRFYAGRSVLITGATGFMGKVLVERLLSTCPEVNNLFLLMREKNGMCPEKRLEHLKESQVFDILRRDSPKQLDKLVLVPGDVTQPDLGMSSAMITKVREVSIVFHSAATVKFNEGLRKAVDQNLRSVIILMDICDKLPNIQALIHVSTAYSNAEVRTVQEIVYPPPKSLQELLDFVDSTPDQVLEEKTTEYISPKPNTYTFTKAMAEHVLAQRQNKKYPVAIFRPTIVISSYRHPFPGWIENLNGPTGIIASIGKGLMRVSWTRGSALADMIPVDIAIDTLIAAAWETAVDKLPDVRVYNCTTIENGITYARFQEMLNTIVVEYPLDNAVWYPHVTLQANRFTYRTWEMVLQTIPHHLITYIARLLGIKSIPNLSKASQKVSFISQVLSAFALNDWNFLNGNVVRLRERLTKQDAAIYNLDPRSINWSEHITNFVMGTRRYVLRERDQDIEQARRHIRRLKFLHIGSQLLLLYMFLRIIIQTPPIRNFIYYLSKHLLVLLPHTFKLYNFRKS